MRDIASARRLADRVAAQLVSASGGDPLRLFVLLDGSRIHALPVVLHELEVPHTSLYRGSTGEDLSHVAPYLAHLAPSGPLVSWLCMDPAALDAALLVVGGAALEELNTHLRRFLLVRDSNGRLSYLRFYDPRVIGPLIEASNAEELDGLFGPVDHFFLRDASLPEDSDAPPLWGFGRARLGVARGEGGRRRPGAMAPFALRPEHEAAFSRAMLARYDARCVRYLRIQFPGRLGARRDDEIRAFVREARELAPSLDLVSGRDVTTLAEVLVLASREQAVAALSRCAPGKRSTGLVTLRDRLVAGAAMV